MIHKVTHSQLNKVSYSPHFRQVNWKTKRPKRICNPWREPSKLTVRRQFQRALLALSSKTTDYIKTNVRICCKGTLIEKHAQCSTILSSWFGPFDKRGWWKLGKKANYISGNRKRKFYCIPYNSRTSRHKLLDSLTNCLLEVRAPAENGGNHYFALERCDRWER